MIFRVEALPGALVDIEEAGAWYERQRPGLGSIFVRSIQGAIEQVAEDPLRPRLRERRRNIRWILARPFPYRIVYRVQSDLLTIIAVLHSARHERHWQRRV